MVKKLTFLAVLVCFGLASAQPMKGDGCGMKGKRGKGHRGGDFIEMLLHKGKQKLDLSDDQVSKIKTMAMAHKKETIKARADAELAQVDLRDLMTRDKVSKGKVDAQVDKLMRIKTKMMKAQMHMKIDLMEVLTKEQQAKLKDMKWGKRGHGMKGKKCCGKKECKGGCKKGK